MGNTLIDQLRQRVDETQREHDRERKKEAQAKFTAERLAVELGGYNQALQAELRRSGKAEAQQEAAAIDAQDKATAAATLEALSRPDNKTQFVVDFIQTRNGTGVTPAEISAEFKRQNVQIARNYVYSMIARLLAKNRIKRKRGKYFLSEPGGTSEGE